MPKITITIPSIRICVLCTFRVRDVPGRSSIPLTAKTTDLLVGHLQKRCC